MPYTSEKPAAPETSDQLRARIPGWGADLDPADRPSVPRELAPDARRAGAHWDLPDRQPEVWPREHSIEHVGVTPVFGTSCPPKALSGVVRKLAYRRYSEARAAHWLLLLAADRIDGFESHVASLVSGRPDNPFIETGLRSERSHHGVASRLGHRRVDVVHHLLDPIVVAAPATAVAVTGYRVARFALRRARTGR